MKVWSAAGNERILEEYHEQDEDIEVSWEDDDSNPPPATFNGKGNAKCNDNKNDFIK